MRIVVRIVVAVLVLMTLSAPTAVAEKKTGGGGPHTSIVPADRVAGNTGARLLGDWYVQNLSLSADKAPFNGTANLCLDLGRRGKVLAPAGGVQDQPGVIEMKCTVKVGRPVVMIMASADCSTAEPAPFYAVTAREQRSCAIANVNGLKLESIILSVDGGRPVDIHQPKFFEVSKQRRVVFPENAVFGAKQGPATFVAAGWMAEIRGMKKGDHTVRATTTSGNDVYQFIVHFEVVGGSRK